MPDHDGTTVLLTTQYPRRGRSPGDDVWWSLAWSVGLIAVFASLAIRKFDRSTA